MTAHRLVTFCLAALTVPSAAWAAEVPCWFDAGVLVVPAEVAGIGGDYILDTGAPRTLLHETKAQAEGIAEPQLTGDVRVAGLAVADRVVGVQDLDVRTWNLPTPAAGVLGADVLKDHVVEVEFAPCRVRIWAAGKAPLFRGGRRLALTWDAGVPVAVADAADEVRHLIGPFVIATGANLAVRLADDVAAPTQASAELYPQGVWMARLPELDFAGLEMRDLGAGLMKPQGEAAGVIGGPVLSRFRLRFDFPAGELWIAPR